MTEKPKYSVVIPLYNKREYIERAVRSAAAQSVSAYEILVVDDGSSDGGAEFVEGLNLPSVRVIRQKNGGVSSARNCGAQHAQGEYIALLDADDWWNEDFLYHISIMIRKFPGCGIYCTGYWIHRRNGTFPNERKIKTRGIIKNYFREAFSANICWTSACVIPREIFMEAGGFPIGMRRGQDLYMWTKIACKYDVCYLPIRTSNYNLLVENNSRQSYRLEDHEYSFMDFYTEGNDDLNEYLARYQIGIAILQSINGYTEQALKTEKECSFTRRYRLGWWKLHVLNRLPIKCRKPVLNLYKRAAWLVSRKGVLE